ncbi:hypothetical protein [Pedobacter sp. ISL-64]|uniref:hypothetical protein n=1 Tax=Pedobacter sp. ISL-64 TaxID=2819164 RepID=UPI001BEBC228|nr:hypothetical protein [Pedobacter sp. ISL-64]MBT2562385.1 hypothetical protein [Pedobacter sp. ISL-64]
MKISGGFLFNYICHCEKAFQPTKQSFLLLAKHFLKDYFVMFFGKQGSVFPAADRKPVKQASIP